MNKSITILLLGILLFSFAFVSAEDDDTINSLDSVKQNECILIPQGCGSCSYINITVIHKNETMIENQPMINNGAGWTYSYCNTSDLGRYDIQGKGDMDGNDRSFKALYFEVTPSGNSGSSTIVFFIFVILLIYGITFTGFFGKNIPITILGGMAMIFLGIYLVNNGVIIYRDNLTNYIAYLTIAIGAILSSWAGLEQLDVI